MENNLNEAKRKLNRFFFFSNINSNIFNNAKISILMYQKKKKNIISNQQC